MLVKFKWLGTAAYILEIEQTRILFDPFFFRNSDSSPVLKTKREELKNIDAIFITHGHIDHVTDAAWFAENQGVPVYTSETGKENMIKWCAGEVIDFEIYELDLQAEPYSLNEKGKENIHTIDWGQKIKINEHVSVESIKSEHITFDLNTIWARVKSKEFWKNARKLIPLAKELPMGKVFGYCTSFDEKKIISYGSLYHKYTDILDKYEDTDVFIAPLAGNSPKNMAEKACEMIDHLKPSVVIPMHWDDFFPPISRLENLDPFLEKMEAEYPDIKIIMPEMEKELEFQI
jgi:L-ascorbate metabolism protein UlaG (beta-lactamase superfamily)